MILTVNNKGQSNLNNPQVATGWWPCTCRDKYVSCFEREHIKNWRYWKKYYARVYFDRESWLDPRHVCATNKYSLWHQLQSLSCCSYNWMYSMISIPLPWCPGQCKNWWCHALSRKFFLPENYILERLFSIRQYLRVGTSDVTKLAK